MTWPGILLIVFVSSTFLGIDPLLMASYFYPEPLMLLLLLIGTETVLRTRNIILGWLLIGACGWFKNEGILYLPVLWLTVRAISGKRRGSFIGLLLGGSCTPNDGIISTMGSSDVNGVDLGMLTEVFA